MQTVSVFFYIFTSVLALAAEPLFETSDVFPPGMNGNARSMPPTLDISAAWRQPAVTEFAIKTAG
jgi:hypothetical protein